MDLFGTEAEAGKSLGTDLDKGKLTWPVLLAWERATVADRAALEKLIARWEPGNLAEVNALLAKYGTFAPAIREIERYLEQARHALRVLPPSPGQTGLIGLTNFLAQQTAALTVQ